MEYSRLIKEERERQKMSQKELAERAGVTRRAVIYWENGQMKPSLENADRIFRALSISVTIGLQPAAGLQDTGGISWQGQK